MDIRHCGRTAMLALALAGCSQQETAERDPPPEPVRLVAPSAEPSPAPDPRSTPPAMVRAAPAPPIRDARPGAPGADLDVQAPPAAGSQIAYVYADEIKAPHAAIAPMATAHQEACNAAGLQTCWVESAKLVNPSGAASAELNLRATPAWIAAFRNKLRGDLTKVGGEIVASEVAGEDLSLQISDVDASLAAKTALRDRLQRRLVSDSLDVQDMMMVERELSQAQSELDAARSQLAVMRSRVATSQLTLTYTGSGKAAVGAADDDPIGDAVRGFARTSAGVIGAFITVAALLWPVALLSGATILGVGWWKRRRRKTPPPAPNP